MKSILFVSRDKNYTKRLEKFLSSEDYNLIISSDDLSAIAGALKFQPAIIICDISDQAINGFEIYNKLQHVRETAVIPFLFISENIDKNHLMATSFIGADGFLLKPENLHDLLTIIRKKNERTQRIKEFYAEKNNKLFQNPFTGILYVENLQIINANTEACNLLGYTFSELKGKNIETIICEEQKECIMRKLRYCYDEVIPHSLTQATLIRKTGETLKVDLDVSLIKDFTCRILLCCFKENHQTSYAMVSEPTVKYYKLSKRETEVLKLICEGYTNSEIANALFLSERTVQGHRARIMEKVNVKNTAGLVRFAIVNNLLN